MAYEFGIIGEHGPIEGVTVTTYHTEKDEAVLAKMVAGKKDEKQYSSVDAFLQSVKEDMNKRRPSFTKDGLRRRLAAQGAEGVRPFPI